VAKRSYQQHCGLAAALDAVGERWTLLIVRDLAPGPRRFTDLFEGLPGIATDMLAERLRTLEVVGVVEKVDLRHPAPARLYRLTERGKELARISGDLARWGLPLLAGGPSRSSRRNPAWALQMLARSFRGGAPDGEYRWSVDDHDFTIVVAGDLATMAYGHGDRDAVVSVTCGAGDFFSALRRRRGAGFPDGVQVEGSEEALRALLAAMPSTTAAAT